MDTYALILNLLTACIKYDGNDNVSILLRDLYYRLRGNILKHFFEDVNTGENVISEFENNPKKNRSIFNWEKNIASLY